MNFEAIKNTIKDALAPLGVSEYEIYYMASEETSVETLNREINGFKSGNRGGLCLRVVLGGKLGYASTELMDEAEMRELAKRACDNARYVEKPDTVGIFAGSPKYEEFTVPQYKALDAAELKEYAKAIGDKLFECSDKVQNGSASQAVSTGLVIRIANSHGLDLSTSCGVNAAFAEAVVKEGEEYRSAYSLKELKGKESVTEMVDEAVSNALDKIGGGTVSSGKYNIVISPKQMRALLSVFSFAFSARQVLDGISLLRDKIGDKVAADIVTVTDDPQREGLSIGTTFDAEGVATSRKEIIGGGVLKTYLHNRETALAMGVESTANAQKADYSSPVSIMPHSFAIEAGDKSFDELLALAGEGIYLTELQGLHAGANPVTGDFSLQAAGYAIKDGKLGGYVQGFTVAGNFYTLLKEIRALGNNMELGVAMGFTTYGAPAALVCDMAVAGK